MPHTYEYPHPAVACDVALLRAVTDADYEILLIERRHEPFAGHWALPGGFIEIDEDLEAAARRELHEETGLHAGTLVQIGAFGAPDRDPRERVISVVYAGFVPIDAPAAMAADDAADARWYGLDALPELAFDHACVIAEVRARLAL